MTDIFLKLVDMSISASFLVAAVLVLRLLLRRGPKWINCLLWALVALRLLCPFSPESSLSLQPERQELTRTAFISQEALQVEIHSNSAVRDIYPESVSDSSSTLLDSRTETPVTRLLPKLAAVWLAGMGLMLIYALESYWKLHRRVDASVTLGNGVYLCDYIQSPFILGIFRPKIYLPSCLSSRDADLVLAHERAHLARRDHWWKPLGFVLLAVYWFNPMIWLAYILLCRDIELACDERVVQRMDVEERKDYSHALLNCSVPRHLIAACPLAFGEVGVKQRVKSVLHYKKPAFWIILCSILACLIAAVCFLTDPVEQEADTETRPVAGETYVDDSALEALYREHAPLAEFDWSQILDRADTDRMTLFDPQFVGDFLFVGCQYEDSYGIAILVRSDRNLHQKDYGFYKLWYFSPQKELDIVENGGVGHATYDNTFTQASAFIVWDESITSMTWSGDYDKHIPIDHYPALIATEHTDWNYNWVDLYFSHSEQISFSRRMENDGEILFTYDLYRFIPDNDVLFPAEYQNLMSHVYFAQTYFHDGLDKPGYFLLTLEELAAINKLLNSVPAEAVSVAQTAEFWPLYVTMTFWEQDVANPTTSLTLSLQDDHVSLSLYLQEDGMWESSTPIHALQLRYDPLTEYLSSLADRNRTETTIATNILVFTDPEESVDYTYQFANMTIPMPIGWVAETVEYTDDQTPFGIRIRPQWEEGWLFFAFCPQGYSAEESLYYDSPASYGTSGNGYSYLCGYQDEKAARAETWLHCQYSGLAGTYVVINEDADDWMYENRGYIDYILRYSTFGASNFRRDQVSQLVSAFWADAGELQVEFDWKTGQWTVTPDQGRTGLVLDSQGNVLSLTSTTATQAELEAIAEAIALEQAMLRETESTADAPEG